MFITTLNFLSIIVLLIVLFSPLMDFDFLKTFSCIGVVGKVFIFVKGIPLAALATALAAAFSALGATFSALAAFFASLTDSARLFKFLAIS